MTTQDELDFCPLEPTPLVRRTDPQESKDAAGSLTEEALIRSERYVLWALALCKSPVTDDEIIKKMDLGMVSFSPSRIRSARKQLERRGKIERAGTGVSGRGRKCALWQIKKG